jgi:hypothetical protein
MLLSNVPLSREDIEVDEMLNKSVYVRILKESITRTKKFFFLLLNRDKIRNFLRPTQLHIQWIMKEISPGVGGNQPGRKADNSSPSSAEFKKTWSYASTPHTPLCFGAYLIKHRGNCI